MKNWLFIIYFLVLTIQGRGQNIDSINTIINSPSTVDTTRINSYLKFNTLLEKTFPDTVIPLNTKVIHLASEYLEKDLDTESRKTLQSSIAIAYNNIGVYHYYRSNYPQALIEYQQALTFFEKVSDSISIAKCLGNIGNVNDYQGDIEMALEYYNRALQLHETIGNKQGIASTLNKLAIVYHMQNDVEKCVEYFNKSLEIQKEIGNKRGVANLYNNIGMVHDDDLHEYEKALQYYRQSLAIHKMIKNENGIANSLNTIGYFYRDRGLLDSSLSYYNESLWAYNELKNKLGQATANNNLAQLHLEIGNLFEAKKHGKISLEIANEIGSPNQLKSTSKTLMNIAKKEGDFKEALAMYELHIQMKDSINNEKTQKATIRQQTKYEFEKEQLIADQTANENLRIMNSELKRRDNLQYSIILVSILVVFGLVLFLGKFKISPQFAEGLIFFAFLILFEFLLVLSDPYIDQLTGGAPAYKLFANAVLAALIFPAHAFFEKTLKKRLFNNS